MRELQQWVNETLKGQRRITIPIMTYPGIELCKYKVKDAVTNGKIHAEAILKLNEVFPVAASTIIMDLTVEAEAFGAKTVFSDNEVPTVINRLVTDFKSVENLKIPNINAGRIQEFLLANQLTAQKITDKPVLGGCIGPFSLAGRLFGMTEIMMAMLIEPDTVDLLLEKCTIFIESYCHAIKATGVDGVIMAEPAAGLLANDDCSNFSSKYIKKIIEKVQDNSFMIVLHNCGNNGHCTQAMLETKAASLHFGNQADMIKALEECPDNMLVMGNIDPVGVLKMAKPQEVKEAIANLLELTKAFPNFVLSTGCDVPPNVPLDNIKAFFEVFSSQISK